LILDAEVFDKITHVRSLDIQATAEDMIGRVHRRVVLCEWQASGTETQSHHYSWRN